MEQSSSEKLVYKNYGEWLKLVNYYVYLYQGFKDDLKYSKNTKEKLLTKTDEGVESKFALDTQSDMDKVKHVIDELLSSKMFSLKYQLIHQIKNSNFFKTPQGKVDILNKLPEDLREKFYPLNEDKNSDNELKFSDFRSIK